MRICCGQRGLYPSRFLVLAGAASAVLFGAVDRSIGSLATQGLQAAKETVAESAILRLSQCVERGDAKCASDVMATVRDPRVEDDPNYLELRARALALQRRKAEALGAIEQAIKKDPNQYRYLMTKGRILQRFDDQPSAIYCFLLADRLRPHAPETLYSLGMSFFLLNEYDRAKRHFQEVLKLEPQHDRAEFMLGVIDVVNFRLTEAKEHLEKALAMQPNSPYYHLHYGILLSRLGDRTKALKEMLVAEKLSPGYPLTHYNLGHLYKEMGNYEAARTELETAVRLQPNLPAAYFQLGRVYQRLGLPDKSREAYQRFQQTKAQKKEEIDDPMKSTTISEPATPE